jgi:hypothetical protein
MGKPGKMVGWVVFIIGWIILIVGMAFSFWLATLIEDGFVKVLVCSGLFIGSCFVSVVLLGIGGRMADIHWKVPGDGGWD